MIPDGSVASVIAFFSLYDEKNCKSLPRRLLDERIADFLTVITGFIDKYCDIAVKSIHYKSQRKDTASENMKF
jgi:hypothetical protein